MEATRVRPTTSWLVLFVASSLLSWAASESVRRDFAPRLSHQPAALELPAGTPTTIECPVEARPEAQVSWFKDEQVLAARPAHSDQTANELMFFALAERDSGLYHCEATNYLGSARSDQFALSVQTTFRDPQVKLEPAQLEVAADQPAEFTCSLAAADEAEQPGWRRNGRRLHVEWLDEAERAEPGARHTARRLPDGRYALSVRPGPADDNATFSCHGPAAPSGLAPESNGARLRVAARRRPALADTLRDLAELARPSPAGAGVALAGLGLALLLVQLVRFRRARANRYVKQPALYAASTGSAGSDALLRDPVLSGLMGRALLGAAPAAPPKQRAYRDHWHKVAAAELGASGGAHLFARPLQPSLCKQSAAARDQARSLLRAAHLPAPATRLSLTGESALWAAPPDDDHYQLVQCDRSTSGSSASSLAGRHNHYSVIEPTGCRPDQLSPYAVSSVCAGLPPPVTSEALRALAEQFDINQLMLLDQPGPAPRDGRQQP